MRQQNSIPFNSITYEDVSISVPRWERTDPVVTWTVFIIVIVKGVGRPRDGPSLSMIEGEISLKRVIGVSLFVLRSALPLMTIADSE